MDFRILGPLWVAEGDAEITPTAPKVRQVLSFLLMRCGKPVQVEELIDELWGDQPPSSAMTTLQTYIYKLRKEVLDRCPSAWLHTRVSGYLLDVPAEHGDLLRFERMAREGRAALENGQAPRAADLLSGALALWRGPALADVAVGEILSAYVTRLEEERLRVLDLRIVADLELGRHQELVSELKGLVTAHPLHERFHAHLMLAMHRSGRRYEALEVYQGLRRMLIDELGMEPSAMVQRLHADLLNSEGAEEHMPRIGSSGRPAAPLMAPAQLPPDVPDFVGRERALEEVRRHVLSGGDGTAVRAVSISGMACVGKTALALRAAHSVRADFPDGQLYADLRGTTDDPADPQEILEAFARAIGLGQIPAGLEERGKLFRTWCNGRRVLVVLDDAASVAQVVPLLPASPHCRVVITGRTGLHGLAGGRHIELRPLPTPEAVELLAATSGRTLAGTDRPAAERIARHCGNLPLAVRCVGARLAAMRTWPLKKMAARLEDWRGRLDELRFADLDPRARLDAGYRRLSAADRSTFRLVSLLPPPYFTAATASRLVGADPDSVEVQLIRLVGCHLLEMHDAVGDGGTRYALHELVRIYARERLDMELMCPTPERPPEPRGRERRLENGQHYDMRPGGNGPDRRTGTPVPRLAELGLQPVLPSGVQPDSSLRRDGVRDLQ